MQTHYLRGKEEKCRCIVPDVQCKPAFRVKSDREWGVSGWAEIVKHREKIWTEQVLLGGHVHMLEINGFDYYYDRTSDNFRCKYPKGLFHKGQIVIDSGPSGWPWKKHFQHARTLNKAILWAQVTKIHCTDCPTLPKCVHNF